MKSPLSLKATTLESWSEPPFEESSAVEESRAIPAYWTKRAHDFAKVRRNELMGEMGRRWLWELEKNLGAARPLKIFDVGTGTGYFAILLASLGHEVTGIDLTPAMIAEAKALAAESALAASFFVMNAEELDFPDAHFDAVISRNLTWTLPHPARAYSEWLRVLKPGGVLLNFDADYASQIRHENGQNSHVAPDSPYGHLGMTESLARENARITLAMPASREERPRWDEAVLKELGASKIKKDLTVGRRVLGDLDLKEAPMFLVKAHKA